MTLLGYMGKALKIEIKEMEELFEDGMQSMRMNYYPPCPQPELVVGLTPHSDATGITILHEINGVQGLQIKKNGVWIPVNFCADSFVMNVGDVMEVCHASISLPLSKFFFQKARVEFNYSRFLKTLAIIVKLFC